MQRAIVHIGLPKAGSTTVQHLLFDRLEQLRERKIRVLVYDGPDDQHALPTRAFDLANCVVRGDLDLWWRRYLPESALPEFIKRGEQSIRQQVAEPEELLVASVEDLSLMRTVAEVTRLKDLLAPREVQIVLVLREPNAWQTSLRGQLVAGGDRTFSNWPGSCRNLREDSWLVDFDALVRLLKAELGPFAVTIIDYDREVESAGTVLPALWESCCLPRELLGEAGDSSEKVWANRSRTWTRSGEPPPGAVDEIEWLRHKVIAQSKELALLKQRRNPLRRLFDKVKATLTRT
jgi:hypothetical protein